MIRGIVPQRRSCCRKSIENAKGLGKNLLQNFKCNNCLEKTWGLGPTGTPLGVYAVELISIRHPGTPGHA